MPDLPTPQDTGRVAVNGVDLWYQTYGEGDPLILLHGGFGTVEMFGPNIAILARDRRVIGVDLQAHGGTGPLGRPMSFEAMATDVAELIGALGYDKADVMGYSLGGGVALRLAIDHPQVVDRLVLVSMAHAYSSWHQYNYDGMRAMGQDPAGTAKSLVGSEQHSGYVSKAPGGEATWEAAVAEFVAFIGQDYDWSAEIAKVSAPTLLIVADWDAVRISAATRLFELLGGGAQDAGWDRSGMGRNRFAVLPSTSHYDILDTTAPSQLAAAFLADD